MPPRSLRGRWAPAALVLALAAAPGAARGAGEPVTIENIRVGFQDQYKVGAWTPVWVDLKGGNARFQGTLEIEAPDDDGTPTVIARPVDVPSAGIVTVATVMRTCTR